MESIVAHPPFLLAHSEATCWKCGSRVRVHAMICSNITEDEDVPLFEGPYFLTHIESFPTAVLDVVLPLCNGLRYVPSHTAGFSYYANTCSCGANFGDHYLFSEPEGAFFPTSPTAAGIIVEPLPLHESFPVAASYSSVPHGVAA